MLKGRIKIILVSAMVSIKPVTQVSYFRYFTCFYHAQFVSISSTLVSVSQFQVINIQVIPSPDRKSRKSFKCEVFIGMFYKCTRRTICDLASSQNPCCIFSHRKFWIDSVVGFVSHTPKHYARMVTVTTYHLFHLLFLNLHREFLVINTGRFLIYHDT